MPEVSITDDSIGIAGEELQLTCNVTTVDHLVASSMITVQWSGGSVGIDGVNIVNEDISNRTLTFSPLLTSHGAEYICQATINIPSINVTKTGSESTAVFVQSKCMSAVYTVMRSLLMLCLSVPSPEVMVSATQSMLVSGTTLTLSCSITQPSSVPTPTTVMYNWTAPNSTYDRVLKFNATSVELVISSVETADGGDYICSATLTDSSGSSYIIDSQTATDYTSVTVSK